jgi:repressor LexA
LIGQRWADDQMAMEKTNEELLLDFIRSHTDAKGYPPSTREMAAEMGFKSVESIHRLLQRLRDAGKVEWEARKARTLRVLE